MSEQDSGIDEAVRRGFHELIAAEMGQRVREMINARPAAAFADLAAGAVYLYGVRSSDGDPRWSHDHCVQVFRVVRTTAGGKQAVVRYWHDGLFGDKDDRAYAGNYRNPCVELDDVLVRLLGVGHRAVVEAAVSRGLVVPPIVRCEYPELFVEIPERFALKESPTRQAEDAASRVRNALAERRRGYPSRALVARDVDRWVRDVRERLRLFLDGATCTAGGKSDLAEKWYAEAEQDFHAQVDFCAWLRPLVASGGVFYVGEPELPEAASLEWRPPRERLRPFQE